MKLIFKRGLTGRLIVALCMAVLLSGCKGVLQGVLHNTDNLCTVQTVDTAMGTVISQKVIAHSAEQGEAAMEEIQTRILFLEEQLLSWRLETSEVYQVNLASKHAADEQLSDATWTVEVEISDTLKEILISCKELSADSEGAFDVTIGNLVQLWNIDAQSAGQSGDAQLPSEQELKAVLQTCGYRKMSLQGNTLSLEADVQLDLGAVGKGIALDEILQILEREGVHGAVISVGGSVVTYGSKEDGSAWNVAVTDPVKPSKIIGYLSLPGGYCVSTSGDYERYVEVDGVRYAHILDPHTGYPPQGEVRSVTILTKNGLLSDGLSTACFLLGCEKGVELAKKYGAEALFVDRDGNITMTDGMRDCFFEVQ